MPNKAKPFWSYVTIGGPDECWPWQGGRTRTGHGHAWVNGKHKYAHRHALELSGIPVPRDNFACHRCNNAWCCNPSHIYVGTPSSNQRDAYRAGKRPPDNRGERSGMSKLSVPEVLAIRAMRAVHSEVAKAFNICPSAVSLIKNRKRWKHVE